MNIELALKEATETGEVIKIRYHGGSQPGELREIAPISIQGTKVTARCFSSDAVKTFVIEKVEIVEFSKSGSKWEKGKAPVTNYENLAQLLTEQERPLNELGWHIESSLSGDQQSITLHSRFKNGKPKKGADVGLSYEKYAYEMVVDWESDSEFLESSPQITGERKRPWSIFSKDETTKSYGSLDKAVPLFMVWAQKYAPAHG